MEADWSFVKQWAWTKPTPTWTNASLLAKAFADLQAPLRHRLALALDRWNLVLTDIGGEPLHENWRRFRPLRRGREEDWSDWLAWLIENSTTGRLAAQLFSRGPQDCCVPGVDRELVVEPYRLDLRIRWSTDELTTLEVKVGDQDFEKTVPAAAAHSNSHPALCDDWILLPPKDLDACDFGGVRQIGWDYVARSLRGCISDKDESLTWRVWGRAFVGCIEQDLLGYPCVRDIERLIDISPLLKYLEGNDGIQ